MALTFVDVDPLAREQWEYAAEIVGRELVELTTHHDQEVLNRVEVQTFSHALAMAIALDYGRRHGLPEPVATGGMSLGEMLVAYTVKSIDFPTLLRLAAERGRIQSIDAATMPPGGCGLLIGVTEEAARDLVAEVADLGMVDVACSLGSSIYLISGFEPALSEAQILATEMGWRWVPQPAEAPWHTSAMDESARQFREYMASETILDPQGIFISASRDHPVTDAVGVREVIGESITGYLDVPALTDRLHAFAPDRILVRLTARGSLQPPRMLEPFAVPFNVPQDIDNVLDAIGRTAPAF